MPSHPSTSFAIVGDVHGHLQLALCTLARWQRERGRKFSAVFLVGDVGTFTEDSQLDNATRKHARDNLCELEFLTQWSMIPQAPWLAAIFRPEPDGLGLSCPVVMVHGNHEGFAHLATLYPHSRRPIKPVPIDQLPPVDSAGSIFLLPPGWSTITPEGYTIAGVGGIEPGQRRARYHEMAFVEEDAVMHVLAQPRVDILITHQGPPQVQGDHGSPRLELLLESGVAAFWFHGHSTPIITPTQVDSTMVVPLGDVAFSHGRPGMDGWAILDYDDDKPKLTVGAPPFLKAMHQRQWLQTPGGRLVHPDLVPYMK